MPKTRDILIYTLAGLVAFMLSKLGTLTDDIDSIQDRLDRIEQVQARLL